MSVAGNSPWREGEAGRLSLFRLPLLLAVAGLLAASPARAFTSCRAADLDGDGVVDEVDLARVQALVGQAAAREDLDGDGVVTEADVVLVWRYARPCADCAATVCDPCSADFDATGAVDLTDRNALLSSLGHDCRFDLNRDGGVCPWDSRLLNTYLLSSSPLSAAAARADFNGNGIVDAADKALLEMAIPPESEDWDRLCAHDLNHDGKVDTDDLRFLLSEWGDCPEGSAGHGSQITKPDVCDTSDDPVWLGPPPPAR